MYLYCANGAVLDLSKERVLRLTDEYWNDPEKLPDSIRRHKALKTCDVCPFKGQDIFCSVMKPLLPFLEDMEKFHSYDRE